MTMSQLGGGDPYETSSASIAYREIKRRIVEVEFRFGEKLSEARLVEELGLGRSPIRSALAKLKNEGWIFVSPQSGTYVKALSNRDVEEVTELRLLLEMHATSSATVQITDAEMDRLAREFETYGESIEKGNVESFIRLDNIVHSTIYEAARNKLITDILVDLRDKVQWIRHACSGSLGRVQEGYQELQRVYEAMRSREADAAAALMKLHIHNAAAFCRTVDMTAINASHQQSGPGRESAQIGDDHAMSTRLVDVI